VKGTCPRWKSGPIVEAGQRIDGWFDRKAPWHRCEEHIQERYNLHLWLRQEGSAQGGGADSSPGARAPWDGIRPPGGLLWQ